MSSRSLDIFCAAIWQDPNALSELRAVPDRATFVAKLVQLAIDAGYAIPAGKFEAVLTANYLSWLQRWT